MNTKHPLFCFKCAIPIIIHLNYIMLLFSYPNPKLIQREQSMFTSHSGRVLRYRTKLAAFCITQQASLMPSVHEEPQEIPMHLP